MGMMLVGVLALGLLVVSAKALRVGAVAGSWQRIAVRRRSQAALHCWRGVTGVRGAGPRPYTAVMIVPTGIGASIGGYAGDALPAAKLLASVSDVLITHPNVMNGAMMYWPIPNVLYVEGLALDEFAANRVTLRPLAHGGNAIGLLLDKALEPALVLRHIQVADAARATLGINVAHAVTTAEPLGVQTRVSEVTGASWGTLSNSKTLIQAARHLRDLGCDAIAVVGRFPEDEQLGPEAADMFARYREGQGVDGIAGAEALISHLVTKHVGLPCAHAPAFAPMDEADPSVSPKACAEELGYTFLPCVLAYLHRAPRLTAPQAPPADAITCGDVQAVVAPIGALGGPAILSFLQQGAVVVAVEENRSAMQVPPAVLPARLRARGQLVVARSYAEAAGIVMAHRQGILLSSISADVPRLGLEALR